MDSRPRNGFFLQRVMAVKPGERFQLQRFWRNELFLPVLFFLLYALANAHLWKANVDEAGDEALIGLQTYRAAHFRETIGPYSRAGFHHPGPISFYAYAAFDHVLPFITSSDIRFRFGQLILNGFLFVWAMAIFRRLLPGSRGWVYLLGVLFLIATSPLGPGYLLSVWGPHILIVSYLLFFLAYLSILQGREEFLAAAVAAVFIIHNHISGATLLLPIAAIGAFQYIKQVRFGSALFARRERIYLALAIGFVFLTSIPPLLDQFLFSGHVNGMGNLSKINFYFTRAGAASRKFSDVLIYIASYYSEPLRSFLPLPALPFFFFFFALPLLVWNRLHSLWRSIYRNLMLVFALSLLSALRVPGDLLPHLFWHLYPFVALHYLLVFVSLGLLFFPEPPAPRFLRVHAALTILALCATVYRLPPLSPDTTDISRLYDVIKEKPGPYHLVFHIGTKDHNRWVEGAGLALKIVRSGKSYCVDREWEFMFPPGSLCQADFQGTTVHLHTIDPTDHTVSQNVPGTIQKVIGSIRLVIEENDGRARPR